MQLEILTEEQHFLTVNKPAGLFSQAAQGIDSVCLQLTEFIKQRDTHPGKPFIGLPHRLDRATSGVMLIARNRRALARFGEQFQSRKVSKLYLALLDGKLSEPQTWCDYLAKVVGEAKAVVTDESAEGAKRALLSVQPIADIGTKTLALVHLLTGRMHQIRVQASHRGLPVFGDPIYGEDKANELGDQHAKLMALHACQLEFHHPKTAKRVTAGCDMPPTWIAKWPELEGYTDLNPVDYFEAKQD